MLIIIAVICIGFLYLIRILYTDLEDSIFKEISLNELPLDVLIQFNTDEKRGRKERGYKLNIYRAYEIVNPILAEKHKTLKNKRQLYHGTSRDSAISISKNGFKLPSHNLNMFGPGIYLAQVPQKAYEYTDIGGFIIVCDVSIGKPLKVDDNCDIDDPNRMLTKKTWLGLKKTKYDSLHAPAGQSTISDEHIIFDPDYILPKYVLSVEDY